MKAQDLGWLAGIIEGEGCFDMSFTPRIKVEMRDKDIVQRVHRLMGGTIVRKPKSHDRSELWVARIYGDDALKIMSLIRPLMGKRRRSKIDAVIKLALARPRSRNRIAEISRMMHEPK